MAQIIRPPQRRLLPGGFGQRLRIDWSHPLTRGLSLFQTQRDGTLFQPEFIDNGDLGVISGAFPTYGVGPAGPAHTQSATVTTNGINYQIPQTQGTCLIYTTLGFSPTDGIDHLGLYISSSFLPVRKADDNNWYCGWNSGRVSGVAAAGTYTQGQTLVGGVTYSTSAATKFYLDGKLTGTGSNSTTASTVGTTLNIALGDTKSAVYWVAIWNRQLSVDEIALLSADPWCMLVSDEGELPALYLPAGGRPAGIKTRLGFDGSYGVRRAGSFARAVSKSVVADPGSYALTGSAATLRRGRVVTAASSSYVLTGSAATLRHNYVLTATTPSSYTLTGSAAALVKSTAKVLLAGAGSYALTGASTTILREGRVVAAAPGAYGLVGASTTTLRWAHKLAAAPSNYALTGSAATLRHNYVLTATTPSSYALTGFPANLLKSSQKALSALPAAYTLTGTDATLRHGWRLAAASSSYALTGQPVTFQKRKTLVVPAGSYALTGQPATLRQIRKLIAAPSSYALTGQDAILLKTGTTSLVASLYIDPDTFFTATLFNYPAELYEGCDMEVPPEDRSMMLQAEDRSMALPEEDRSMNTGRCC